MGRNLHTGVPSPRIAVGEHRMLQQGFRHRFEPRCDDELIADIQAGAEIF